MSIAIKAENVSKAYQLGEIGTGTISRDLERWWAIKRGREDPYLKIGEINDRTVKGKSDIVWSLKDINFEIEQGDAVGIIGRNGAGKSTLLKLLSRVTAPTTGVIKAMGRIASLLEVGTGFHPDLTGRENIYLNGAILGMRKKEITQKFDEIVDFSGVEKYIDTPVKRYSSGMYVRLAFAVAAHLDSEILIVDEVLAVGDAEFQKKCLGKMGEVSRGEGRTVLFVSHNMGAIKSLCNTCIFLKDGSINGRGNVNTVVDQYISEGFQKDNIGNFEEAIKKRQGTGDIIFTDAVCLDADAKPSKDFFIGDTMQMQVGVKNIRAIQNTTICIQVKDLNDQPLLQMVNQDSGYNVQHTDDEEKFRIILQNLSLFPGEYTITLSLADTTGHDVYDILENCLRFSVLEGGPLVSRRLPREVGLFFLSPSWMKL